MRLNGAQREWNRMCDDDLVPNTDLHCVVHCSRTKRERRDTGISLFFSSSFMKGISEEKAYSNYILGVNWEGVEISLQDYQERGVSLGRVFKAATNYGVGRCKLTGQIYYKRFG